MPKEKPADWVDRDRALSVPIALVLDVLVPLPHEFTRKGDDLQGWCPIGDTHGKKDSFGANVVKGVFNCYACKRKGNVIDLVMAYYGEQFKDAALWLVELADKLPPVDVDVVQEPLTAPLSPREQYLIDCAVEKTLLTLATRIVVADK